MSPKCPFRLHTPFDPTNGDWYWVTVDTYGGPGGAHGNGTADDRAHVQAVITAAATAGKDVYFPAGTYYMEPSSSVFLTVPSNMELRGAGDTSILKGLDDGSNDVMCTIDGTTNVKFTDLKLMGTETSSDAMLVMIHGHTVANLTVTRCTFDMGLQSLDINGTAGAYSSNILVKDCTALTGILNLMYAKYCTGIEISGGNYEVNRDSCYDSWWPHHLYLAGYLEDVYVHDATFTGGQQATITIGVDALVDGILFKDMEMSGIANGWSFNTVNDCVIDGLTWVQDVALASYGLNLVGDVTNWTLKNSTITGNAAKNMPLAHVHGTPTGTNTVGPNVTMTNCAAAYVANDGLYVYDGATKPTIVPTVTVS